MTGCAVAGATAPADSQAHVEALSSLLGLNPGEEMDVSVATVAMIAAAQQRGMTWAQIARVLGYENGKACKAAAKRLARAAQGKLLARAASDLEAA
jgi:hypothetical protein